MPFSTKLCSENGLWFSIHYSDSPLSCPITFSSLSPPAPQTTQSYHISIGSTLSNFTIFTITPTTPTSTLSHFFLFPSSLILYHPLFNPIYFDSLPPLQPSVNFPYNPESHSPTLFNSPCASWGHLEGCCHHLLFVFTSSFSTTRSM